MKYQIRSLSFGNTIAHELKHIASGEAVQILPAYGAQLHQLWLQHEDKPVPLLDSYTDSLPLETLNGMTYKGAKLSPFPNRLHQGSFRFQHKSYHLSCNDKDENALHGFLWNYPFSLKDVSIEEEQASLTLGLYYEGKKDGYPFPFRMDITYCLSPGQLHITTKIENTGQTDMLIGDGWHPYFITDNADHWQMQLPSQQRLITNPQLIPTGDKEIFQSFKTLNTIGNTSLDHCFGPLQENFSETVLYNPGKNLKIILWQKSGNGQYEWLNVYIPPDRNSIAIEPMSCAPDAFNNGLGNTMLSVGESKSYTFGIKLERETERVK